MNKKIKSITIRGEEDKTQGYVFPHEKKKNRIAYMHKRLTFKVGSLINVQDIKKEAWSKTDDEVELIESLELDEARSCLMIFTKSRSLMPILIGLDQPFLEHYEPELKDHTTTKSRRPGISSVVFFKSWLPRRLI